MRDAVARDGSCDRSYSVAFVDREGVVHVEIEKTVYVACKQHYKAKTGA